jgi:5-methylcytosine-specific restriction endonuclease McrA
MAKRKTISVKARVTLFQKHDGVCHLCGGKINVGEAWEVEHIIPFAMGGADDESNWSPAHIKCHRAKTTEDVGNIARAKRREARHIGVKVSKSPLPFGRQSKFKKKMDGSIVPR